MSIALRSRCRDDIPELARQISDRRFGVGADGLILICPSERADAEMRMYNADGSYGEMCGNGIRCVAKYVYDHGIQRRDTLKIESAGRMLSLDLIGDSRQGRAGESRHGRADLDSGRNSDDTLLPADRTSRRSMCRFRSAGATLKSTCVSMGNPHCVVFVDELTDDWVLGIGPKIEVDAAFSEADQC